MLRPPRSRAHQSVSVAPSFGSPNSMCGYMKRYSALLLHSLLALLAASCGGSGGGNPSGVTDVQEITSDDSVVPQGGGTVFRVDFSIDENDIFNTDDSMYVVLFLPRQLAYRAGLAEIDGYTTQQDDSVEPAVLRCADGGTYLAFTFDRYGLDNAEPPSDDSDAQLKLTLNGVIVGNNVVVDAAADDSPVPFSCAQGLIPDAQEVVSVR